jgi:hypothetical protein
MPRAALSWESRFEPEARRTTLVSSGRFVYLAARVECGMCFVTQAHTPAQRGIL